MTAPRTFQEVVHDLDREPLDAERGLRFCFGREANHHAGVFLPWAQVAARVRGVAAALAAEGVGGGDVVLVHAHDQQVALLAILGAIHLGAIPAAVAPLGAGTAARLIDQFHAISAVAGARLIVSDRALPAEQIVDRVGLPPVLVLETLAEAAIAPVARRAGTDEACFLQFTSGSTSVPKGVVVTHRMLLANLATMSAAIGWGPQGRAVGWLPIYHDMSLVGIYAMTVLHRARACLFPTSRFGRDPGMWLALLAEERAHFSAGPNFAFAMINRLAERRPPTGIDLSTMRGFICGSEPISAAAMRGFAAVTAPLGLAQPVIPAFGMAECTLMATCCAPGAPLATITVARRALEQEGRARPADSGDALELVGCGPAAPGMAIAIDLAGEMVGDDQVGEVLLAGDSVLGRYWRNDAATAGAFLERDGRRWFRTGDLGFTRAGQLYVCGRAKDLIIHNGVNYYPADIEHALATALPGQVRLAAVVDLRTTLAEEFTGLGVLFEEGRKADDPAVAQAAVATFVRTYTGLPVALALALRGGEHIPRTTSGKLVRHEIRARLNAVRDSR